MANGKRRSDWEWAATIAAFVANTRPGAKLVYPWQINPFGRRPVLKVADRTSDVDRVATLLGIPDE